jgi:Flp pilus assembly protein TadG
VRPASDISAGKGERGVVILLVAVVLLFIVGAMAALAIDVVTFYTARSEAQTAADAAALAGARELANSGLTSSTAGPAAAETLATTMAKQVATRNEVGGRTLNPSTEVTVTFNDSDPSFKTNPRVTVQTTRTDLPTFFARIWGNTAVRVQASATAEAYNPSGVNALGLGGGAGVIPVAPTCVRPWILTNVSPNNTALTIFNPSSGAIADSGLLGWSSAGPPAASTRLRALCEDCTTLPAPPDPTKPTWVWAYYPADPALTNFPPPSAASVSCAVNPGFTPYQLSVAGCVQRPIGCNSTVNIDTSNYPSRDAETGSAVNCLTHSNANEGDSIDPASGPPLPFQFLAGADNPVVQAGALPAATDILVSDSLVTVPVYNSSTSAPVGPVTIIGFVQLFLNPDGRGAPVAGGNGGHIRTTVINLAGCGTGASGQPILGNGASPVPVRLLSPQQIAEQ